MTKIEAITRVMQDNGGAANWNLIYDNIEKHYPKAKKSKNWQAGIRGVLYRELNNNRHFKKIGLSIYALRDYQEEKLPNERNKNRMHSFIEGVCLELGNFKKYLTYTADPSAVFRDNIRLDKLTSLKNFPEFTYPEIITQAKRIDVVWFNQTGFRFPQKIFEVVDSPSTLTGAFNRSLQLLNFGTECYIVAPQQHKEKFDKQLRLAPFNDNPDKFRFINYDNIIELHENTVKTNKLESTIFNF